MGTGSRLTQHTRLRTLQVIAFLAFITTWILLVVATKQQFFRPRNRDHKPWHSSLGFDLSTCLADGEHRCWAEAKRRAWLDALDNIERNFTEDQLSQYRDPVRDHRTSDLWPVTYDCDLNDFSRVGRGNDGGKWICGPLHLENEKCVIFSLGSNGDFSFERSMREYTNRKCEIHTFDCTGSWKDDSTNFHPWCIAGKDEVKSGRTYKRLATILKELKLPHISYLKMDIEGYEWQALPDIFSSEVGALPKQISFEIHSTLEYAPFVDDLGPNDNWAYPMIRLGRQFDEAGYRVAAREDNHVGACGGCSEFVLVRESDEEYKFN